MGLGGLGSGRGRLGVGLVEFCIFGTWLGRDLHKLTVWGGGGFNVNKDKQCPLVSLMSLLRV